jgi:hypothetical protein
MARTFSRPSQVYAAGTYGPFPVDGLTSADTDELVATFTVEGWPEDANPLLLVQVRWDNGSGADFALPGRQVNRDGTPRAVAEVRVGVPQGADERAAVAGGTIALTATAPLRTAVTFGGVSNPAVVAGASARRQ